MYHLDLPGTLQHRQLLVCRGRSPAAAAAWPSDFAAWIMPASRWRVESPMVPDALPPPLF